MSDCSENKNPLVRNGTSQGQRVLSSLSPGSVEVIDKTPENWMVWAGRFSENIQFTSLNNGPAGTMKPFFSLEISAQLALAASYAPTTLSQFIREKLWHIETEDSGLKEAYTDLFHLIFSYFVLVDQLFQKTQADSEYSGVLLNHIRAKLRPLESRTFAYYKASLQGTPAQRLIINSDAPDFGIFNTAIYQHQEALAMGLSSLLEYRYTPPQKFADYYNDIDPDPSIFGDPPGGFVKKIKYVSQHNFFTSILDEITASTTFITKLSKKYLSRYLSSWPNHKPGYALFLAWLQLLEATKEHLNELTKAHLDFYYKRVLQLRPLEQKADRAFLTLELNKVTNVFALQDDTVFIGPKDALGNHIHYDSIRETVLNKAKIAHLVSLYYGNDDDDIGTLINKGRLFAAPVANSADGLGAEFEEDVISWHPFHIKTYQNAELHSIDMPRAAVGFAIASHYLRLHEGNRVISLEITPSSALKYNEFNYQAFVTTEKEWYQIVNPVLNLSKNIQGQVLKLEFTFTIPADIDPIVAYDPETHLGNFASSEPVLKIVLEHNDNEEYPYEALSKQTISNINLTVEVGEINGGYNENGLKNLELHNDRSPLNPSKPFHPWGPEPTIGNSFIIGSEELFYKRGAEIQLNFHWKDYPLTSSGGIDEGDIDFDGYTAVDYVSLNTVDGPDVVPEVDIFKLSKNKWISLEQNKDVFRTSSGAGVVEQLGFNLDLSGASDNELFLNPNEAWKPYDSSSNRGFIKIRLNNDFGHRDYYNALRSYSKSLTDVTAPKYPYQPTLQSFSISYKASCSLSLSSNNQDTFRGRPLQFFHTGPFGDDEQHRVLQKASPKMISPLIRQTGGTYKAQGSLFIGFENLLPGDTQSVLFQLQEGSEDPLLEKPEEHLIWEYLSENGIWKTFEEHGVGDNTSGLIESGLINFTIPKDATLEHSSFPSNLIWVRCSVAEATDAVCKIIGIHPNTVEVNRIIPKQTEYSSMIAEAGQIKKLYVPEARIKKIQQTYSSFDGRPKEASEAFYLRASERLRHKNRAITIWDFERLVLQAFPEIYKVKCLNHTLIGGSLSEGDLVYNEIAPGHVSIITIPNLANRNDIDPLKPYTKKSTLKNIEDFLEQRSSCQVKIHTAQPDFEEVQVKCTIILRVEYTDTTYYRELIQKDITNYLSPWAFSTDSDLNFGGRVHQSVLIDFIEELPYVDYLTDFELYHIKSSGETTKVDEAIASTARSILVSVPADKHLLTVLLKPAEIIEEAICNDE